MTLQGTTEWHQERLGKPTASRFEDIKPGKSGGWSVATMTYMKELIAERLTGQWAEVNAWTLEWGNDHEDDAKEAYTIKTGQAIIPVGFVERDGMGGSPDGLVGDDGMIEIKCPAGSKQHIDYILNGCDDHLPQIQANMYFTDRKWCDFISYDPRMPEDMQLFITRIARDDKYIVDKIAQVQAFQADLKVMEETIRESFKTIKIEQG
jgi:hypothetical protein